MTAEPPATPRVGATTINHLMRDYCVSNLLDDFHTRFEVITNGMETLQAQASQLRYQVYCVERGYHNEVITDACCEIDEFDDFAMHAVVRDRRCGTSKATVRLVTAGADRNGRFPIEHAYPNLLAEHGIVEDILPRAQTAEISRFAVSKTLRQRQAPTERVADGRLDTRLCELPGGALHRRPMETFGLLLALIRLSAANDITHCLAVMEPSLLRMLSRFGVHFHPIGPVLNYHGRRQPCYMRGTDLLEGMRQVQPELWRLLAHDPITRSLQAAREQFPLSLPSTPWRAPRELDTQTRRPHHAGPSAVLRRQERQDSRYRVGASGGLPV